MVAKVLFSVLLVPNQAVKLLESQVASSANAGCTIPPNTTCLGIRLFGGQHETGHGMCPEV